MTRLTLYTNEYFTCDVWNVVNSGTAVEIRVSGVNIIGTCVYISYNMYVYIYNMSEYYYNNRCSSKKTSCDNVTRPVCTIIRDIIII